MRLSVIACVVVLALPLVAHGAALTDASAKWTAGDKSGAIAAWRGVVSTSKDPKELDNARSRLADALLATGDTAGAVAVWNELIQTSAQPTLLATAKMRVAYCATKQKVPVKDQIAAFMRVVNEHPTTAQARTCLLRVAYLKDKSEPKNAAAAFGEVSARYPGTREAAEADYRRGMVCERGRQNIDEAIRALEAAAENRQATSFVRQAAAVEAGSARIMKYMGSASKPDVQAAADYIKRIIPTVTDCELLARARLAYGECCLEIEGGPEDAPPPLEEALERHEADYIGQAETAFKAVLSSKCSAYVKLTAWYYLGHALPMEGEKAEAKRCLDQVLAGLKGATLKEKQKDWVRLRGMKTANGHAAGWSMHVQWNYMVQMAAWWQAEMLRSMGLKSESEVILRQIVEEYGTDKPKHWTVKSAEKRLGLTEEVVE